MMHGASLRTPRRKRRRQASRAAATQRSDAKDSKAEDGKDGSARAWTTIDEMRAQADATSAHADDLRKFADVACPLYDSLDAAQQKRFGGFVSG